MRPDPRILALADALAEIPVFAAAYPVETRGALARQLLERVDTAARARGLARYDRDPDALAWAREKVEAEIDRCARLEQQARSAGGVGSDRMAKTYRSIAVTLKLRFLGSGCLIGAFDERRPELDQLLDDVGGLRGLGQVTRGGAR